jgi:hypothetical protein
VKRSKRVALDSSLNGGRSMLAAGSVVPEIRVEPGAKKVSEWLDAFCARLGKHLHSS